VRGSTALAVCRVALLWAAGVTVLFPVVWIALASVKTPEQLSDPFLLSFTPTLDSWRNVLTSGILAAAGRSAIVAIVTVGISVVVGSMGAYAIARYRAGGTATRFGMLAAQVLPPAVLVFPFLTMAYALRLNDTLIPVIFAHLSFVLPVVTWFLIGFFEAVPRSLEEQAQVDGRPGTEAAELAEPLPQRRGDSGIVDVRAHQRRRALARQQVAPRVAQQLLIVSESEVHTYSSSSCQLGQKVAL